MNPKNSTDETRVSVEQLETAVPMEQLEELGRTPEEPGQDGVMPNMHEKVGAEDKGDSKGASTSSSPAAATADGKSARGDPAKTFRDDLLRISSIPLIGLPLQLFMAKSDEYPRFVWQDFLLSFQAYLAYQEIQDEDQTIAANRESFGSYGLQKLSHIIDCYPDILQRELLRDSFELAVQDLKRPKYRYGSLHAAVLCGRVDLVYFVRDPDKYRNKILKRLTPDESGSFNFVRRAVLWKHMERDSYARVATFMKKIEKVRMTSEIEKLTEFIEESTKEMDVADEYDPWIIILAWSAVSTRSQHIRKEFKKCKSELFEQILTTLEASGSAFRPFLSAPDQKVTADELGHGKPVVELTVRRIIRLLVLEADDEDVDKGGDGDPAPVKYGVMQKFFLDRLSERTPTSRWSPLHLAAARGDHEMVSLLIHSCQKILKNLGKQSKKFYESQIQMSFHDVRYMTPLHYAVLGNHKAIVESLVGWEIFQPHVNDRDVCMRTAFHLACSKCTRKDIAEQLVENRVIDVNIMDCCSFTGVHWAVYASCTETATVLMQKNKLLGYKEGLEPLIKAIAMKDSRKLLLNLSSMKNELERLFRDRQVYVDASNAILVGAALIASVTFGGWLQPPLGKDQDAEYRKAEVSAFWVCNSLSFFFSIATVMAGAAAVLPVGENNMEQAVESIRKWLVATSFLLIASVTFVLGAFAAAGLSSLSLVGSMNLNGNMAITTGIGSAVCGTVLFFFCLRLWSVRGLNQIFKVIRGSLNKEEILKMMNPVTQVIGENFPRGLNKFSSAFLGMLEAIVYSTNPRKREESDLVSGDKGDAVQFGPWKPKSLEDILKAISTIPGSGSEPYAVHYKKIEDMWKVMHLPGGSKSHCPIRKKYEEIESWFWNEIRNFNISSEPSLQEYVVLWRNLSREPLKDTDKTMRTAKKFVASIVPKLKIVGPTGESYV